MNEQIAEIAQRWEKLSAKAQGTAWASSRIRDLAKQVGFDWYESRGDERLKEFLEYDGKRIFQLYSLGKTKITRLCDILEILLENDLEAEVEQAISPIAKARVMVERWNVPVDFPCSLIALPTRVRHYCEENQIATLDALLGEWERLGSSGFIGKKHLGRKSVDILETFIGSLIISDLRLASRFLPLQPDGFGVDFSISLSHVLLELSPAELEMLKLRIQDGMTLEESAETYELTRERVRQLQAMFLAKISMRLDYFRSLREDILRAWVESDDWFALVKWNGDPDHGLLLQAGLESIFHDSPQAVARDLSDEARMEELEDKLAACPDLWFGGTSLEGFLDGLNADEKEAFCEQLTTGKRFRVDHSTGRVHPSRTDLRCCIEALVAEEDDPIPLTWLVELVKKTGYHPRIEPGDVLRRRNSWRQRDGFPDQMILWPDANKILREPKTMIPPEYFDDIRLKSSNRWQLLESDPELAGPWHQLFKQVQSPRHVLSELLQNADDAGATRASAEIRDGAFYFEHNGEDFCKTHFASLCRFGYSNKRTLHTIGFRGIGFKSTFSLGECVELYSPSLSVKFHRNRFTEPSWEHNGNPPPEGTRIRVQFQDENRKTELEKNLREWLENPISLIFFRHLRQLSIRGTTIGWKTLGPGPVANSEWLGQIQYPNQKVLRIHSEAEAFPEEALEEIRQERLLSEEEQFEFPPSRVEIVLGASGRLYVVLPTGVQTALPFASNAPFIQDPARFQIKDPQTSPTNRWLLQRCGSLAARSMLEWLKADVAAHEAYALLPSDRRLDGTFSSTCADHCLDAFAQAIENQPLLLTMNHGLVGKDKAVIVPDELIGIWSEEELLNYLHLKAFRIFAPVVVRSHKSALQAWELLNQVTLESLLGRLNEAPPPAPATATKLLQLWKYLHTRITGYFQGWDPSAMHLIPVQGEQVLLPANRVVRIPKSLQLESENDWDFLRQHLKLLDSNIITYLEECKNPLENTPPSESLETIAYAEEVLKKLLLAQPSDAGRIINQVVVSLKAHWGPSLEQAVHLAEIAAQMNAQVSNAFPFYTRDGVKRFSDEELIADSDGMVADLFPPEWRNRYLLHQAYHRTQPGDQKKSSLNEWLTSEKSGLDTFVKLQRKQQRLISEASLNTFIEERHIKQLVQQKFKASMYLIEDWDFDSVHLQHWRSLAREDETVWKRVLVALLNQPETYWRRESWSGTISYAEVHETSQSGARKRLLSPVCPAWVKHFQDVPCLPDTKGFSRKPNELMLRTEQTEAFIDIEPFLAHALDTSSNQQVLLHLGVNGSPPNSERILQRLRSLSKSSSSSLEEVAKWYLRLDHLLPTVPTIERVRMTDAFQNENLIFTEASNWARSGAVFLECNENDAPGTDLIPQALRNLPLWRQIGVEPRPSEAWALNWLRSFETGKQLVEPNKKRVLAILARHPKRVWHECQHWLNLNGDWNPTSTLIYSLSGEEAEWKNNIYPHVRKVTADIRFLPLSITSTKPFDELRNLTEKVTFSPVIQQHVTINTEKRAWLRALGTNLRHARFESDSVTDQVRDLATDLEHTLWQSCTNLELMPYLDGSPIGTPIHGEVIWIDRVLFVKNSTTGRMAHVVPQEISRRFNRIDIGAAMNYSYERSVDEIDSYMRENFDLEMADSITSVSEISMNGDIPASGRVGNSTESGKTELQQIAPNPTRGDMPVGQFLGHSAESLKSAEAPTNLEPAKKPTQNLVEIFAASKDFQSLGPGFKHADGRRLEKNAGAIAPWELLGPEGTVIKRYWAKDHCIECAPLELPTELWHLLQIMPSAVSLLLRDIEDVPIEITANEILLRIASQDYQLVPTSYRLVNQKD